MEYELVGIFETEGDDVTFFQSLLGEFFSVQKNAELVSPILHYVPVPLGENRHAVARDAAVGNGQLVSGVASANQKWRLVEGNGAAGVLGRNEFENRFIVCAGVCHGITRNQNCITILAADCITSTELA